MILLVVAAQLSSPMLLKPLIAPRDVPVGLIKENILQTVRIALTVKPDGKVQNCRVEESSGNPKLDSYTCDIVVRRAKFRSFNQVHGRPMYGVYRTHIDWWVGDGYPPSRPKVADVYVTVSALPPKARLPTVVRLKFAVDETGRISDCAGEDTKYDATLVRIGCDQLLKSYRPMPAWTVEGVPVASVQTAIVAFQKN